MAQKPISSAGGGEQSSRIWSVVRQLLRHPVHSFVVGWNWKAGALSVILRVPVYVITTLRHGWQAASLAGLVEGLFTCVVAGVYAALTEAIRNAEPEYMVAFLLLAVLPAITLCCEALIHSRMHTPNLAAGVAASFVVSIVSSAFNWYSMRRGTLLVGPTGRSFASDLLTLPLLIARFLGEPLAFLWRTVKHRCTAVL